MRTPILIAAAAALAALAGPAAADPTTKDIFVRPGQPVRVTVAQTATGADQSTTWVIAYDDGQLAAVDVEFGTRASAGFVVRRPGRHRISLTCGNHIATTTSCTIATVP